MRASAAAGQPDGDAHEIATYNDFSSGQTAVSSISALICDSALTTTTSAAAPTTPTNHLQLKVSQVPILAKEVSMVVHFF